MSIGTTLLQEEHPTNVNDESTLRKRGNLQPKAPSKSESETGPRNKSETDSDDPSWLSFMDLVKVSRPGWYLVNTWLYLAPTGTRADVLTTPTFILGWIYSVFSLNVVRPRKRNTLLM
jgi:hypothetical protein